MGYELHDGQGNILEAYETPERDRFDNNMPILAALKELDAKSIRALREGNAVRVAEYEAQAVLLRAQLIP